MGILSVVSESSVFNSATSGLKNTSITTVCRNHLLFFSVYFPLTGPVYLMWSFRCRSWQDNDSREGGSLRNLSHHPKRNLLVKFVCLPWNLWRVIKRLQLTPQSLEKKVKRNNLWRRAVGVWTGKLTPFPTTMLRFDFPDNFYFSLAAAVYFEDFTSKVCKKKFVVENNDQR